MFDLARPVRLLLVLFAAAQVARNPERAADRRVVDTVDAGDARSEADHGYAAQDDSAGVSDGRAFRQARGWMRYAVTTFDDTDVTIECTFLTGNAPRRYDVVVEDSVVASRTLAAGVTDTGTGAGTVVVEVAVPFTLTKGRSNIAVVLRGRGGPTPALHKLRTVQEHHEFDTPSKTNPPGVAR